MRLKTWKLSLLFMILVMLLINSQQLSVHYTETDSILMRMRQKKARASRATKKAGPSTTLLVNTVRSTLSVSVPVSTNTSTTNHGFSTSSTIQETVSSQTTVLSKESTTETSWYGPGFYGHHTACGQIYTQELMGVAHKTLPCGTLVTFSHNGLEATVPVIDRGPYTKGRMWDLSYALCNYLEHCFTGPIDYRY